MIAHGIPIYVALEPVDMRFGCERLGGVVREKMQAEPRSRALVLYYKRLERGRFRMPRVTTDGRAVEMGATELAMLLDGIDVRYVRRPEPWRPKKAGSCTQGIDKTIAV